MNRILRWLGYRDRTYREQDLSVEIEQVFRECIAVVHTHRGIRRRYSGERIGRKWEGLEVHIPADVSADEASQISVDLATAFRAMGYGYVIAHEVGTEVIPDSEKDTALAELRAMGYEIEFLPDGKIRQTRSANAPKQDIESLRKATPRMMMLIHSLRGRRTRLEVLAKSKEF